MNMNTPEFNEDDLYDDSQFNIIETTLRGRPFFVYIEKDSNNPELFVRFPSVEDWVLNIWELVQFAERKAGELEKDVVSITESEYYQIFNQTVTKARQSKK